MHDTILRRKRNNIVKVSWHSCPHRYNLIAKLFLSYLNGIKLCNNLKNMSVFPLVFYPGTTLPAWIFWYVKFAYVISNRIFIANFFRYIPSTASSPACCFGCSPGDLCCRATGLQVYLSYAHLLVVGDVTIQTKEVQGVARLLSVCYHIKRLPPKQQP